MFKVEVFVKLKDSILDPQGKVVENAMHSLGFENFSDVRIGKYVTFTIEDTNLERAESKVKEVCDRLIINPVIESYQYAMK